MKTNIAHLSFCFLLCFVHFAFSQKSQDNTFHASMVIKTTPLPFLAETVLFGKMSISKDTVFFKPVACSDRDKKAVGIFPCNAHLIKNVAIPFKEIKKIAKRNFLFFIPNRLLIVTQQNEGYLFITYHRKAVKRSYLEYLADKNDVKQKNVAKQVEQTDSSEIKRE